MYRKSIFLISFIFVLFLAGSSLAELVMYWPLDEGSGATAVDVTGNGNDGVINGTANWVAGMNNLALDFNGSSTYIGVDHEIVRGTWSLAMWIRPRDIPYSPDTVYYAVWHSDGWSSGVIHLHLRAITSLLNADFNTGPDVTSTTVLQEDEWYHAVVTVTDEGTGGSQMYINGILEDETAGGSGGDFLGPGMFGNWSGGSRFYHGLMDDIRIYDHVLSETEVLGAMARPYALGPNPEDGSLYPNTWVSLSWKPGIFAASHDVYIGDNFDDVNGATRDSDVFRGNQGLGTEFYIAGFPPYAYPDGLTNGTTYYWRIDEVNDADPNSPWKGDVWSFMVPPKIAYDPVPANNSKFIDIEGTSLTWTPGFGSKLHYVYFGDDYDMVANATSGTQQVVTSFNPGPLELEKTYYWRIDEYDGAVTHKGDVWSFTTIPAISVTDPNLVAWWKLDEGSSNIALDWSGHGHHGSIGGTPDFIPGYDGDALDFDGSTDFIDINGQLVSGTFTITLWINPRDIPYSSGYYAVLHDDVWDAGSVHIHLRNTSSLIDADINSGPGVTSTTVLQADRWYHCALTVTNEGGNTSELYINGVLEASGSGGDGTPYLGPMNIGAWENGTSRHYHGLMDDIRIYDRVLTSDEIKETMRGDPLVAWDPSPTNGSTPYISLALPLTWSPGDKALQHEVYFGTDKTIVENADASDTSGTYKGIQSYTSYTPPEGVEWGGGPYYWRIDENNNDGTITKGRIWTFTVADFALLDDFESYDSGDNQIWYFWHDGLGYGAIGVDPYFAGNSTGSAVGDETTASYTEETIVHGGSQSMPFTYDNNKQGFARYSETELTLTAPRDWTDEDVAELSIWFRGYPASVGSFAEGPAGTYTMTGSGTDIWDNADEFHFAYKMLTGQGSIVARVESVQETNTWAKAGVMIRESLEPGSVHATMVVTPAQGISFQRRTATDDISYHTTTADIEAPYWVKVERDLAGNLTASSSTNGTTWTMQGVPENIPMTSNIYIGLALTSHDAALTCEAVFTNVTTTGNVTGQWTNQDIGIESNDAEPLYVAVSNTAGQPAVVVHDDANASQIDTWTEWVIPLQAFADQGIDLSNVDRIAIGLGTKGNMTIPGGSGKMFIDDIRLYRLREADGE